MNIEDLYADVAEYHELDDVIYSKALEQLACAYETMDRDEYYEVQRAHNEKWADYPKINL